ARAPLHAARRRPRDAVEERPGLDRLRRGERTAVGALRLETRVAEAVAAGRQRHAVDDREGVVEVLVVVGDGEADRIARLELGTDRRDLDGRSLRPVVDAGVE